MRSRLALSLTLTLPLLAAGCTEDQVALEEVTETPLGVSGGRALSAGGELSLGFEAGALDPGSVVRITTDRSVEDSRHVSPVFDLEVEPAQATFDPPVEVVLNLEAGLSNVAFVHLAGADEEPVATASYDPNTGVLQASLTHFSRYVAQTTPACPAQPPQSGTCAQDGLRCEYGEECCCGQCYPSQVWSCSGGQWAGYNTDACLRPGCPDAGVMDGGGDAACPAEPPSGACGAEGLRCEYGEECCCGQCYPALVYQCIGGEWGGYNTDACLRPECPDAG